MFQFMPDEIVIDHSGPLDANHHLNTCSECKQVAFRVLHLKSANSEREVALCGAHFTEACARYPGIRRAVGMRIAT